MKPQHTIKVCHGHSCSDHFPQFILDRAKAETEDKPYIEVESCGCLGECEKSPNISIDGKIYTTIHGPQIAKILEKHKL